MGSELKTSDGSYSQKVAIVDATGAQVTSFAGGGGGGGAVTVADGADVTQGTTTDAAAAAGGIGTEAAKLRLMTAQLATGNTNTGNTATSVATLATAIFAEDAVANDGAAGVAILGMRQDSRVSPVSATGDWHSPTFDYAGRMKVWLSGSQVNWQVATSITNSATAVQLKNASGASTRNRLTSMQVSHATLASAVVLAIRDSAGGTVIWQGLLDTSILQPTQFTFQAPLLSGTNGVLEAVTLTPGTTTAVAVTGSIYINAQGDVETN